MSLTITTKNETLPEVCHYCSTNSFGGLEMNVVRLLAWLKDEGCHVQLMAPANSPVANFAKENNVPVTTIEINKKYFDVKRAYSLAKLLKANKVKIFIVAATRDVAFGSMVKRYYPKLKLIYHSHMQLGISKKSLIHTLRFRKLDKWIVSLPYLKKEVGERTNYPVSKVDLIPFCVDTAFFTGFEKSKEECRKELGLPVDKKVIGILGRIDRLKRQQFLVQALKIIHEKGEQPVLVIMGEPTRNTTNAYYEELKQMVKDYQLDEVVIIKPFTKEIRSFYRALDVFAMATKGETYGMVTIEAMVNGTPVLACNSGGSVEILEEGELGNVFDPDSLDDFCEKYSRMIANWDETKKLAEKVKQIAVERYDKSVMVKALIHIFDSYLKEQV